MPPELQHIEAQLEQAVAELRAANDATRERDGLQAEQLARLNAEVDRLSEAQADLLRRMRSPQHGTDAPAITEVHERAHDALSRYIRRGDSALTAQDQEALEAFRRELSVDSDPDGGYLVTPQISSRIITRVEELNPIRQLATVETITTDALEGVVDSEEAEAGWVGERQERSETGTPRLGTWRIPVHEMYAAPKATQRLLDDAGVDVEAWLARKVAARFAKIEGEAFLRGDGNGKPHGLLAYPAGKGRGKIEQIPTGAASALEADAIIRTVYALASAYAQGAAWLMNRATLGEVRLLKDAEERYIWAPGFGGQPSTLAGYPVHEAAGFDNVAAGKIVAAFGNIREAYTVVDRQGIRTLRDPYSRKPYVEFYTTKRTGGAVLDFDAVKLLKVAAS